MGVKAIGIEELLFQIKRNGELGAEAALDAMKDEGVLIRDLARKMAPVDTGDLEEAINVQTKQGRDWRGRFGFANVEIYIDSAANRVADYAYVMHEHLFPYGAYKLGPKSRAKQERNLEVMVGGKFLERAIMQREPGMIDRIAASVYRVIR